MTLDQRRAAFALKAINSLEDVDRCQEYRAYARRLPSTVIRAGLGQALALELAQSASSNEGAKYHANLLNHVSGWLVAADGWGARSPYHSTHLRAGGDFTNIDLIKAIMAGSEADMIRAQVEVMAFLKWLKIFAEALIPPRDACEADANGPQQ